MILVSLSTHLGLGPVACSWMAGYPSYQMHWRNEAEESGQVVELQDWVFLAAVELCVYVCLWCVTLKIWQMQH